MTRLAQIPDWLRTTTGRVAVGLGALAVAAKISAMLQESPGAVHAAALAAVALAASLFAYSRAIALARDARLEAAVRLPWGLLAAATAPAALAAAVRIATELGRPQHLALARQTELLLGLAALALATCGVLLLPAGRLARGRWVPAALDLATLLLTGALGFWVYALYPAFTNAGTGWLARGMIVGYTALSLLLLVGLLALILHRQARLPFAALAPLVAGGLLLVAAESIPVCHLINTEGMGAEPMSVGWTLFSLAAAVSAHTWRDPAGAAVPPRPVNLLLAVPLVATGLVGFLVFTSLLNRQLWEANAYVLLSATFVTLVLVVLRQTLIARDNVGLAQEAQRAKEAAEAANAARLHFLANISHDLRTPLNGVLGCAQILLREKTLASRQRELVKTMQGCAEHLRNLINDLLDLSKLEANRLELAPAPFDLRSFLQAIARSFAPDADNKKVELQLDLAPDLPGWIVCDLKRLHQILGNLLHNALKFTEHGAIRLQARVAQGCLRFEVQDTGCGILPDQIERLFQPFQIVDERSLKLEGSGLGLSICKKLAEKMGGDISVQSVRGKGSVFIVTLPLQETAPVVEVQRTVVDYQGRRRRILIVDDQPSNRIVLRAMLEPLDFLVDEAGDAARALEHVRFAKPDVVLLDLMMPAVDGFELCRQIAVLDLVPAPACLAVSALSGDEVEERCRQAGFRQLLHKPVDFELLLDGLHTHAGIEWTYGVIQPPPDGRASEPPPPAIVPPPAAEVAAFLDLARRGFVRNIESRAEQLARTQTEFAPFARRVTGYVHDFKLKELAEWLASLNPENDHGSA